MSGRIVKFLVMLLGLAGLLVPAGAQVQSNSPVSASVQPAQVTVGDSLNYEVSISVTGAGQPSVAVPVISSDTGLSTPSPAGTQTSVESYIVNGNFRSVQRITYSYVIRASKEGQFTIPPATVTLNGKNYETQPVTVTVLPVPKAADLPTELEGKVVPPVVRGSAELKRKLTGAIFVLPVVSNDHPYNGEQVRLSYHLVIDPEALKQAGLMPRTNLDGVNVPAMGEFIKEELFPFPQELKFQERQFGNRVYLVAPVYEAVITSTKTGPLQIDPFQISMIFTQNNQRRSSVFPDDPLLSSMDPLGMLGGTGINVIAQSPELKFDVKPLPEKDKPADYSGAVGSFKVVAEVDKKQARAYDDTIQLDVTVAGEGNTESLSPPQLPDMPEFTVLGKPEEKSSSQKDDKHYISLKKFTYTLRPVQAGSFKIPPISMPTFEPEKQAYTRVQSDPIDIKVSPGSHPAHATASPAAGASADDKAGEQQEQPPAAAADYRFIATEDGLQPGVVDRLFGGRGAALLFLVPFGVLAAGVGVAAARKNNARRAADHERLRAASSSQHLKQAAQELRAGNNAQVYAEIADGVRLFFASKFSITPGEATIPEIEERLQVKGAPAEYIHSVSTLLENCDSARYAPVASAGDARAVYKEAERIVKEAGKYV